MYPCPLTVAPPAMSTAPLRGSDRSSGRIFDAVGRPACTCPDSLGTDWRLLVSVVACTLPMSDVGASIPQRHRAGQGRICSEAVMVAWTKSQLHGLRPTSRSWPPPMGLILIYPYPTRLVLQGPASLSSVLAVLCLRPAYSMIQGPGLRPAHTATLITSLPARAAQVPGRLTSRHLAGSCAIISLYDG